MKNVHWNCIKSFNTRLLSYSLSSFFFFVFCLFRFLLCYNQTQGCVVCSAVLLQSSINWWTRINCLMVWLSASLEVSLTFDLMECARTNGADWLLFSLTSFPHQREVLLPLRKKLLKCLEFFKLLPATQPYVFNPIPTVLFSVCIKKITSVIT